MDGPLFKDYRYSKPLFLVLRDGKNNRKHITAKEKDHALLYMHLSDLEINM